MTERVWHLPEDRKALTRKQTAELFLRQDGRCPQCGQKLHMKGHRVVGVDEHVNPLWRGGSNDLENRELWCQPCTKPKTAGEATQRAKSLSVRDRHIGAKMPSRGFPASRTGRFKKHLDGRVTER